MELWSIQSKCGEIPTRKTPLMDTFLHEVMIHRKLINMHVLWGIDANINSVRNCRRFGKTSEHLITLSCIYNQSLFALFICPKRRQFSGQWNSKSIYISQICLHCVKSVRILSFSRLHFTTVGLNTEITL